MTSAVGDDLARVFFFLLFTCEMRATCAQTAPPRVQDGIQRGSFHKSESPQADWHLKELGIDSRSESLSRVRTTGCEGWPPPEELTALINGVVILCLSAC